MRRSKPTFWYIYRVFDADGELLYIGTTHDWPSRMRRHSGIIGSRRYPSALWWSLAALIDIDLITGLTGPHALRAARRVESEAIAMEDPWYNVIGRADWHPDRPMPRSVKAAQERALAYSKGRSLGDRL